MALAMYPGLTQGAIAALLVHGSRRAEADLPAQDDRGRLDRHDEPDRAALRHGSRPDQDQGGAATPTAPTRSPARRSSSRPASTTLPRTSSISCWPASRARPEGTQGHLAVRRAEGPAQRATARPASATRVSCGSIEHKMGIHGNSTCVMNYDGATGWLVGEENRGLNAMFVMMNEARLGVGVQGLAQSEVAYQNAVAYAQGAPAGPLADGPEEPGQAGRPDHRPSRRAPHPDDDPRLQRGGARAGALDRAARATSPTARATTRRARPPTTTSA